MGTVQDVSRIFKNIATAHLQIQTFYENNFDELDINKIPSNGYPLMYAQVTNAQVDAQFTRLDFDLVVADIVFEEQAEIINNVLSSTLLIVQDVIAELHLAASQTSPISNPNYTVDLPFTCSPFQFRFDNMLFGWSTNISINVPLPSNLCDALIA
jgi:hypothetical protein